MSVTVDLANCYAGLMIPLLRGAAGQLGPLQALDILHSARRLFFPLFLGEFESLFGLVWFGLGIVVVLAEEYT